MPEDSKDANTLLESEHVVMQSPSFLGSDSFDIIQKLAFFSVIVGVVAIFLRRRSAQCTPSRYPA